MPLLQQILNTQSVHSFYQRILQDAIKQQKHPNSPVFNPPASMRTVLSIQTLNELATARARAKPLRTQEKAYLTTQELIQPGVIDMYKKKGLVYVRRRILSFRESLRNPTIGTHIELLKYEEPCSYHIDSQQAKKLIWRLCF